MGFCTHVLEDSNEGRCLFAALVHTFRLLSVGIWSLMRYAFQKGIGIDLTRGYICYRRVHASKKNDSNLAEQYATGRNMSMKVVKQGPFDS